MIVIVPRAALREAENRVDSAERGEDSEARLDRVSLPGAVQKE
jgi:hypothetical protein